MLAGLFAIVLCVGAGIAAYWYGTLSSENAWAINFAEAVLPAWLQGAGTFGAAVFAIAAVSAWAKKSGRNGKQARRRLCFN